MIRGEPGATFLAELQRHSPLDQGDPARDVFENARLPEASSGHRVERYAFDFSRSIKGPDSLQRVFQESIIPSFTAIPRP